MKRQIKYMAIAEFQALGFLQEANRQFFHPHGLALEITTVKAEPGTWRAVTLGEPELDAVRALLAGETITDEARDAIAQRIEEGNDWGAGDKWLSGIWDYRDDPEGVTFGSGDYGNSQERADRVAAERAKHADARKVLFETDSDVEPLDWTYPES